MLSFSQGESLALRAQTIHQVFAETAARFPTRPALIVRHQNVRLTWSELAAQVESLARGLASLGLEPGHRAGVWSTNCLEWILLQLACARLGAVLVNVNPAYRSWELSFVLRKSRIRALFFHPRDARADYSAILAEARAGLDSPLAHAIPFGSPAWLDLFHSAAPPPPEPSDPFAVANIQYTSGTTGSPKGVLLTHHNLVNNGFLIARCLQASGRDSICLPVPLYHCFGCVIGAMVSYNTGAAIILPSASFDAHATLEAIHQERATAVYGVPTMFISLLHHPDFARFDLSSLRTGVMAGAPCPVEIMKRVISEMHCPEITIAYGQTESSPVVTMSGVHDSVDLRVSTIGRALPCTELKIVHPESGQTVPAGEPGEICARGYMVMKGYDQEPEATARAIDSEGWLHTGDLGLMRPDGYFRITGRARDLIIRGGENIYPREVEEFLFSHPKIADVQVVGLPDARLGEVVAAWIRLRPGESATEEEIRNFCKGRIAHFKTPQFIRFVDEFPMTVTGKIQKFRIREMEIQARGLQSAAGIETA